MKVYSELVKALKEKGMTIAVAESLTGGLISSKITDISGASSVFSGGVVSYTNDVKMSLLGVSQRTIDKYTEVSYQCAEEMALGVRKRLCSDIGISTTGIAGPTGGTDKNPVGTAYVGFSFKDRLYSVRLCFSPSLSREQIRLGISCTVAKMLVKKINKRY